MPLLLDRGSAGQPLALPERHRLAGGRCEGALAQRRQCTGAAMGAAGVGVDQQVRPRSEGRSGRRSPEKGADWSSRPRCPAAAGVGTRRANEPARKGGCRFSDRVVPGIRRLSIALMCAAAGHSLMRNVACSAGMAAPQFPLQQLTARILRQRVCEHHPLGAFERRHVRVAMRQHLVLGQ